jgi:hypothetical protein
LDDACSLCCKPVDPTAGVLEWGTRLALRASVEPHNSLCSE